MYSHHLRNWRLLKRALQQTKLFPGSAEAQVPMSGDSGVLSRTLHVRSGARSQRSALGLGVRFSLFKQHHQGAPSHLAAAGTPLLHALHFSSTTSAHALRDVLPFTIHNPKPSQEEELEHIDAAFQQLSKDPLYQFSSLQSSPLKVTFDGLKTPESKGLLDYANLAEQEQTSAQDSSMTESMDDGQALYNFASLENEKSSDA